MKRSWGAAVALCGGLAALVLVRVWHSPPGGEWATSEHGSSSAADRHAIDAHSGPDAAHAPGAGGGASGGAAGGTGEPGGVGELSHADRGDALRRPPPAPGAQNAMQRGSGQAADARSGHPLASDGSEHPFDAAASHRDLPPSSRPAGQAAPGGADAAAPEAVPEVAYDGGADHVFDTAAQVEVSDAGPISGGEGTISFWMQPRWAQNNQDDGSFIELGDSGMQIVKNGNFLRFEYSDNNGNENGGSADIHDWQAGARS